jgi:DNA helicase II / ATP-dependent DNA helicase PcrA
VINGLNFIGSRSRFAKKSENKYFLDGNNDLYRDGVSDFVVALNGVTNGAVVCRLEKIYTHIFIDEVQDLVGYDLDVLDMLMASRIRLTLVGDPRQHTLSTNTGPRNKKYRGAGIKDWFEERAEICELQTRHVSYRCNQIICDFADAIYPYMPKTRSSDVGETGHDGIFFIPPKRVHEYLCEYSGVIVLRHDKRANTLGISAMNIGVSKGSTFDRVLTCSCRRSYSPRWKN